MKEFNEEMIYRFNTILDALTYYAVTKPNAVAFSFLEYKSIERQEKKITYKELKNRALSIAFWFQKQNAKEERAIIVLPAGIDYICAFLGCLYAGIVSVPCYPPMSRRVGIRIKRIINDANARFVISNTEILKKIIDVKDVNGVLNESIHLNVDNLTHCERNICKPVRITTDKIAFLQYTSGSISVPKGVMVSHGNLIHNLSLINRQFEHTQKTTLVSWLPPFHDMGLIGGILQPIFGGYHAVKMSPFSFLQKPVRWLQAITKYKGTTAGGPNFCYDLCVERVSDTQKKNLNLSTWDLAFNGAEPVNSETLERFYSAFKCCGFRKETFFPCYGLAEGTLLVSCGAKKAKWTKGKFDKNEYHKKRMSLGKKDKDIHTLVGCGRILTNYRIVDPETRKICRPGKIGEIWLESQSVAKGYWKRTEETAKVFGAKLWETGEGPYLRTGDLGAVVEGELFVTGRIKDIIIINGRNYYPQDIENSVQECETCLVRGRGAAFAVAECGREELIVVQEVKRSFINKIDPDSVIHAIRQVISKKYHVETKAVILLTPGSIPITTSGKIQRNACREIYLKEFENENNRFVA